MSDKPNFHPIAQVVPQVMSDSSYAYNVDLYDQDGELLATLGCISQRVAQIITDKINEGCSWIELL